MCRSRQLSTLFPPTHLPWFMYCWQRARCSLGVCLSRWHCDDAFLSRSHPACYLRHTRTQPGLLCSVRNKKYEKKSDCMHAAGPSTRERRAQKRRERCGAHAIKRWAPSPHSDCANHCRAANSAERADCADTNQSFASVNWLRVKNEWCIAWLLENFLLRYSFCRVMCEIF